MKMSTVHYYYYNPKHLNLDKIREEAYTISRDDRMGPPRNVIIHHHRQSEPCGMADGNPPEHEKYFATKSV